MSNVERGAQEAGAEPSAWRKESGLRFKRVLPDGEAWESVRRLLRDPESAFVEARWLKRGTTCSVVRVDLADRVVVVKRYNVKGFLHGAKRLFQPTRAARSWRVGLALRRAGVATPAPYGFSEERIGWLRRRSYVVNEYLEATEGRSFFEALPDDWRERVRALAELLVRMWRAGFHHGDLKATNLLATEDGLALIDLDAAGRAPWPWSSILIAKDRDRVVRNWDERPEVARLLATRLEEARGRGAESPPVTAPADRSASRSDAR